MRREIPQKVDTQINFANWSHSLFALRLGTVLFRRTRSASLLSITLTATALGTVLPQQQATAHLALNPTILGTLGVSLQADRTEAALSSPIQSTVWQVQEASSAQSPSVFSTTPNVLAALSQGGSSQPNFVGMQPGQSVSTNNAIDISAAVVEPGSDTTPVVNLENKVILNSKAGALVHTVEKGENLTEIADKYRVSLGSIAQTNRIPNPNVIDVNEDLVIPTSALSSAPNSAVVAALTQEVSGQQLTGLSRQGQPSAEIALAPRLNGRNGEYAPNVPQVAHRSIFPQIPPLELPPLSSAEQFLPSMLQNGIQKFIWPANGVFTSGYGWRWGRMHRGIDIAAPVGTPVVAAASGVVISAGWNDGGFGNLVEIRHPDGTVTRYAHNQSVLTRIGAVVNQGELIAHMGTTGHSTGPHTHFEIHPSGRGSVDPMFFLSRK